MIICSKAPQWHYSGEVRSVSNGRCVDARSHRPTTKPCQVLGTSKDEREPQIWSFSVTSGQLMHPASSMCFEALTPTLLRKSDCDGRFTTQQFIFTAVAGPRLQKPDDTERIAKRVPFVGMFMSRAQKLCISDAGQGRLQLDSCNYNDRRQHWSLTPTKGNVAMLPLYINQPIEDLRVSDVPFH